MAMSLFAIRLGARRLPTRRKASSIGTAASSTSIEAAPAGDAPALILDVRMNGGGNDQLAFDIAGRFTRSTVQAGYVKFRNGPAHTNFGAPNERTVSPRGPWQFTGNVLLLIGRRCASSNESFIVAMRQMPNVVLVGDRTAGSTGNPGTFPLAGGWSYTMSRWIEYTPDNQVIEDNGITPDIAVSASLSDFASGRDPVLEYALQRLGAASAQAAAR